MTTILQVEYRLSLLSVREEILQSLGHPVVSVLGSQAARNLALSDALVGVVVIGHRAPRHERCELIAHFRESLPGVPIVALLGRRDKAFGKIDVSENAFPSSSDETKKKVKPKDWWDKFSTLSTLLSTILLAVVGGYFTHRFEERQAEEQRKVQQTPGGRAVDALSDRHGSAAKAGIRRHQGSRKHEIDGRSCRVRSSRPECQAGIA